MKNTVKKYKVIIFPVLLLLSVFVFLITYRLLTRPAFSAVRNAECGISVHTHSSECFNTCDTPNRLTLICDSCNDGDNVISHVHDSFCYDQNNELICPIMEYEHCHSAECYNENMEIICGVTYHQHSNDCLHIIEEGESFEVLCCGLPSHDHNESCYPDSTVTEGIPDETEDDIVDNIKDEIVPYNEADVIADDEYYYYDDTPEPFAMFFVERVADVVIDDTNSFILEETNIKSASFQYGEKINDDIKWINVDSTVEIPANSRVKIEIEYENIKRTDLKNNRIVYPGIPSWLIADKTGIVTDKIYGYVADIEVIGDKAVITFRDDYLKYLEENGNNTALDGSFELEGKLDWREINALEKDPKLPLINLNFKFENDLASKYGDFEVTKTAEKKVTEVIGDDGKIHSYLKYELKIKSKETAVTVNNITITDTLSTDNNRPAINRVIKSPGYVEVSSEETTLGNSASGLNPYETITGAANSDHGTIKLENTDLKWTIDELKPEEERILVYYVELNDDYVGSSSAGTLRNEAVPESNGFPRDKAVAEFIPTANVSVKKSSCGVDLDSVGSGELSYQIEVTADPENSYTITDAWIQDLFQWHMDEYAKGGAEIEVTIKSNMSAEKKTTVKIWGQGGGFDLPIGNLKAGEKLTITYSVPVEHVYAAGNKDFNFQNRASFYGGRNETKLEKNHDFGGAFAQTYIYHNSWTRKMNGTTVKTAKTVNFGTTDKVFNSNATASSDTSFVVPEKAQEYIVIVNEDGTWNMSSAAFHDSFNDVRISYTGYLKIEEFEQIYATGTNTNNISDTKLSSDLNSANTKLKQTVWVNIHGQKDFNITPKDFGLENTNSVYRLTYYASINSESSNIKNIVVSNTFNVTGTIGIGDDWFSLNGIGTKVQSTIIGSASYNIEKSGLFYNNGEVYWVIRAEGMLPKDMHLKDSALTNNSQPSLAGVYLGDKNAALSGFATYNDLKNSLNENMTAYEIGTRGITYSLVGINSPADLDGKDYALFSRGGSFSGYMLDSRYNGALKAKHIDRIGFPNNSVPVNADELPQMWHFRLVENTTDRFYVYYTDSSGNPKYLDIIEKNTASVSDETKLLTIYTDENQISIVSENGFALNWFGGNNNQNDNGKQYSAWNYSPTDKNNWHYIAEENTSSLGDFSSDSNGNIYVNRQIDIPKDKAVYMIVRTKSDVTPSEEYSTEFKNEVGVIDNASNIYDKLNEAEYIYKPKKAVKKEAMVAAYYDASKDEWSRPYSVNPSGDRDTVQEIKNNFDTGCQVSRNGSGLYMEWLINVNWDGTLSGDYILTDHLDKDKYEPVVVRNFWAKHPGNKTIDELDTNKWEYRNDPNQDQANIPYTKSVPYYYNKETGEIKISVSGLVATGKLNKADTVANIQLICRVIDPDIILSGQNSTIPNSFDLDKTDGEHINDGIVYHQIRPAYKIDKQQEGVGDTTDSSGKVTHHTNKLNYTININPNKEDFINGDFLPDLIDEMSNSMELIDKIKVYEKDGDTETLLNNISYTTVKGDTTTKITISGLPDETPLVIRYSTRVNTAPGVTAQIYNSAYWKGYSKPVNPQHTESYSFSITGTVSAHNNPTIDIYKVDKYNSNIFLQGAEFEIRKVDTNGTISNAPLITRTTGNNGMIEISTLEYNTVYQLIETKAPTDYVLDKTPRYFMVIKNNEQGYTITDGKMNIDGYTITTDGKMTIGGKEEQVIVDYAVSTGSDMTLNISNAKGKIRVNKIFQNENGDEIYPPENGSFKFGLYEYGQSGAEPVQILNIVYKNSKTTYLLDGEEVDSPEFTKARAGHQYYVYELDGNDQPITGNDDQAYINGRYYNVIYDGNQVTIPELKTTNDLEVMITNEEYNIYLPVTGGKGIFWYYKNALRVLMICLTAAIIVIFLKKRRTKA